MAANAVQVAASIGIALQGAVRKDADGNNILAISRAATRDLSACDIWARDERISATTTVDFTALTLGGIASEDHTNDTVNMLLCVYVSGTGSVVMDNAASTGLSAEIGAQTISASKPFALVYPDVVVGASTHDITLTVTGDVVVALYVAGTAA